MEKVVIAGALRTPAGRFLGALSRLSAPELASIVIRELMRRAPIRPSSVDEVIMGNVLAAGAGQNPARQAALLAGLPNSTSALTVNMVCASGLRAVALGCQAIALGHAKIVIAGGMESMSSAPYLLTDMRRGKRHGDVSLVDSLIHDGLWDCYNSAHMGTLCELTAAKFRISRKAQDRFALESHTKAMRASKRGFLTGEVVPVNHKKDGVDVSLLEDETIRWDTSLSKMQRLKPVFKERGTITAGNSPGLNDAAAALLVMGEATARRLKVEPLAEVVGFAPGHVDPKWFPLAPVRAVKALLKSTALTLDAFDLIEENEAFAAQTLAVIRELKLDPKKVNVNGGAIAFGHPIGASGARILVTLVHALKNRRLRLGLAAICLGGGGAMAMAVRRT